MTTTEAFRAGLNLVKDAGLPAKSSDPAVIVASEIFDRMCVGKHGDPRFPEQAPIAAKRLILECYAH